MMDDEKVQGPSSQSLSSTLASTSAPVTAGGSDSIMSDKKFHGALELACAALGFEVGEVWSVKNHKDVNNRTLLLRQVYASKVSGEQSSHLECPGADAEGRPVDESKHKISPILCRNACDNRQVVWVSDKACGDLTTTTQSSLPLHAATAVPCYAENTDQMCVIVLFASQPRFLTFQAIDFLCALQEILNSTHARDTRAFMDMASNLDMQKCESLHHLPMVFFGEPESLIDIKKHSGMSYSAGESNVGIDKATSERYKNVMSGTLQLISFDIAEVWLPTDNGLKMESSVLLDAALQPWTDFSCLLALAPGLDIPGRISSGDSPLIDSKYHLHEPFDTTYPRALNAKYLGLEVAFGFPVAQSKGLNGAMVYYAKAQVHVGGNMMRLLTCGAALLTHSTAFAGCRESSSCSAPDMGSRSCDTDDGSESKDLIDLAFMSALDTVFEDDETNWGCFDANDQSVTQSQESQPLIQHTASSGSSYPNTTHPPNNLTSRVYSEILTADGQVLPIDVSKKRRTGSGVDISSGIVRQGTFQQQIVGDRNPENSCIGQSQQHHQQNQYHQQQQKILRQQQHQSPQFDQLEHLGKANNFLSNCVNCQQLCETTNGYCKDCARALAAYFSRSKNNFAGNQEECSSHTVVDQVSVPFRNQSDNNQHGPVIFTGSSQNSMLQPSSTRDEWNYQQQQLQQQQRQMHNQHPQTLAAFPFDVRNYRCRDELDASQHSYASDLDVSQHSAVSYQSSHQFPTDSNHSLDLNNFQSTLDISRSDKHIHRVNTDPLDVQHHPVNVNRYHFFNPKQRLNNKADCSLDVSMHSNQSDTDYDLDKTYHPVNADKYRHIYGDINNASTHSVDSLRSTKSDMNFMSSKRKICRFESCVEVAISRSPYCSSHAGNRKCMFEGCSKCAQGSTKYCISHGGGRRCTFQGCNKGARDKYFCAAHGGGKRCTVAGCVKSAVGRSTLCTSHGGGKRCMEPGCTKSSQSSTSYCVRHGGGRKCALVGCNKVARGRTNFCASHKQQGSSDDGGNVIRNKGNAVAPGVDLGKKGPKLSSSEYEVASASGQHSISKNEDVEDTSRIASTGAVRTIVGAELSNQSNLIASVDVSGNSQSDSSRGSTVAASGVVMI